MPTPLSLRTLASALLLPLSMAGISCSTSHAAPAGFPAPPAEQAEGVEQVNDNGDAVAVLAGGCFWCTEAVFERLAGVKTVVSGYAGGTADDADYKKVSGGYTKHAEAIEITYDPAKTRYVDLLEVFFAVAHNPTHVNRQGNDVGPQYRSAVFYANDAQKEAAEAYIAEIDAERRVSRAGGDDDGAAREVLRGRGLPPGLLGEQPGQPVRAVGRAAEGGQAGEELSGPAEEVKLDPKGRRWLTAPGGVCSG